VVKKINPNPGSILDFRSRAEWRDWLSQHHLNIPSAWLAIRKKHADGDGLPYEDAVEEALCFGWIDGQAKSLNEEKFLIHFSKRKDNSVWSEINKHRVERLITEEKMTNAGLEKIDVAKRNGQWDAAYRLKTPPEIPEDLKHALQEDDAAREQFNRFANSYQTGYIVWLSQAKTNVTRSKRIEKIVARARLNKKPFEKLE
jgi:uncharacterized protein YdeI (YjbR/CyaY-like superfamily)